MRCVTTSGNRLYYGDNLDVLQRHEYFPDACVDLIYLDPAFNSNREYNAFFEQQDGRRSAAQIKAFTDTWRWDEASARTYEMTVEAGGAPAQAMKALRDLLGTNDVLAYLSMMAPRLIELRRVLRPTGSIFLHCDPTASHYLKIVMDSIFGAECFVNEIIWHYRKWPRGKYGFQRNHDVILFYARTRSRDRTFNQLFMERAASTLKPFGTAKITSGHDEEGHRVPSTTGEEESEGVRMDDVWDIGRVPPIKQLFPTEKPLPLLTRIVEAARHKGDVVLDPFCGCGTAVVAAQPGVVHEHLHPTERLRCVESQLHCRLVGHVCADRQHVPPRDPRLEGAQHDRSSSLPVLQVGEAHRSRSWASSWTIYAPIPRDPPVTNATRRWLLDNVATGCRRSCSILIPIPGR